MTISVGISTNFIVIFNSFVKLPVILHDGYSLIDWGEHFIQEHFIRKKTQTDFMGKSMVSGWNLNFNQCVKLSLLNDHCWSIHTACMWFCMSRVSFHRDASLWFSKKKQQPIIQIHRCGDIDDSCFPVDICWYLVFCTCYRCTAWSFLMFARPDKWRENTPHGGVSGRDPWDDHQRTRHY